MPVIFVITTLIFVREKNYHADFAILLRSTKSSDTALWSYACIWFVVKLLYKQWFDHIWTTQARWTYIKLHKFMSCNWLQPLGKVQVYVIQLKLHRHAGLLTERTKQNLGCSPQEFQIVS